MNNSKTLILLLSETLTVLRVTSIVYKSITLNNIRKNNKSARDGELDKNGNPIEKKKGILLNGPISDVVLLIISGLCLYNCLNGNPTKVIKSICIVTAILMLIRSFPVLLKGKLGDPEDIKNRDGKENYPERLFYGLTSIINALVAIACC